jgi:hypothetical protein
MFSISLINKSSKMNIELASEYLVYLNQISIWMNLINATTAGAFLMI